MKFFKFVVTGALIASFSLAQRASEVTSVTFSSSADVTRVTVGVSSEFQFKSGHLTEPDRIFFDFADAKSGISRSGTKVIPVGDSLVKQIRVADRPGGARVVLEMNRPTDFAVERLSNPDRLVVEVRLKGRGPSRATTSPSP